MIPAIFEVYNKMHLFGNRQEAKFMYAARTSGILTEGEAGFASACVQCGECLEKCPQQIEIPDVLEDVVDALEGPDLEDRLAFIGKMFKAEAC
jgi:predicted aldo/keto reductase-like oxidoreductase